MFPGGRGLGGPFGGFPSFPSTMGGFGLFGGVNGDRSSLIEDIFGHDPVDDAFFRRPFGGLFSSPLDFFGSMGNSFVSPASLFGSRASFFGGNGPRGVLSNGFSSEANFGSPSHGQTERQRGPVIEELPDDHEGPLSDGSDSPPTQPIIEQPDDEDSPGNQVNESGGLWRSQPSQNMPSMRTFCYQSSTSLGPGGVYYSSSKRRISSNGVIKEESHEMDGAAGTETRSIAKGIGDKIHTVSRKRSADERESTLETMRNLSPEEALEFDKTWERHAENSTFGPRSRLLQLGHRAGSTRRSQHFLPESEDLSHTRKTGSGSHPLRNQ